MHRVYAYASLGRTGLGNMLFPWARCEIFAARHCLPILAPQWTQPKIGPLLRSERDWRFYTGLFDNSSYIHGLQKILLIATARKISEHKAEAPECFGRDWVIVVFRGMERLFQP